MTPRQGSRETAEVEARTLWRVLQQRAAAAPGKPFLVSDRGSISYGEAWSQVQRLASGLARLGVSRGDRVAMLTPPEEAFPLCFLACGLVGAIWVGINVRYKEAEIRFLIEDARPTLLIMRDKIGDRDFRPLLKQCTRDYDFIAHVCVVGEATDPEMIDFGTLAEAESSGADTFAHAARPEDGALIVYTSGSTGKPKGAVLLHGAVVDNVVVQVRRFQLTSEDRFLLHLSPNHVAGSVEMLAGGLQAGSTLILLDRLDIATLIDTIQRFRVTALLQIPTLYVMMLNDPTSAAADLSSLRKLYWAGSAAPREMVDALRQRCPGALLVTGYGMSEVCGFVTYTAPEDPDTDLMDTVGAIDPAFELKVVDELHVPVPAGTTGEIAIRGSVVMAGYWNRPDLTAEAVDADGWYYSGDLGYVDRRGYVTLVGRKKEMYISGGFNIYPREIEIVLEAHPSVAMACVIAEPDPVYQEVGLALLVPAHGRVIDVEDIARHCRENLANFKVPKRFLVRDHLPMLGVGKIDKVALRAEFGRGSEAGV